EQKCCIEPGIGDQLVGGENIHDTATIAIGTQKIREIERGLAKERFGALVFEHQQLPLHSAHRRRRDIAVLFLQLGGMIGDETKNRPQVLQVEQRKPLLVGDAERNIENAFLGIIELQETRQQQRAHFGNRRADWVALLAENVPEDHRKLVRLIVEAHSLGTRDEWI